LTVVGTLGGAAVGAIGGAAYGAVTDEPTEKPQDPEEIIRAAFVQLHTPERLSEFIRTISQHGTNWTSHAFISLPDQLITEENRATVYRGLEAKGIDTVLEILGPVVSIENDERWEAWPTRRVIMSLVTRLISLKEGRDLEARVIRDTEGRARYLTDWAAEDARLFRTEYVRVLESLAQAIVTEVFLLYRIPPHEFLSDLQGGRSGKVPQESPGYRK
jgi:hypothetical protein